MASDQKKLRASLVAQALSGSVVLVVLLLLTDLEARNYGPRAQVSTQPRRIISLIPAVTEMLFAIGAGPQVIAVSTFDDYPPEVRNLERVGALLDPDLERILSLKPDLVAVYATQTDLLRQLERGGVPVFRYQHAGLQDITVTIRQLAARTGHAREGSGVIQRINAQLAEIGGRIRARPRPRTVLVFGREARAMRGVFASGGVGFLHDMLVAAGGDNVFAGVKRQSIQASSELILARRPDVIVELRASQMSPEEQHVELAAWQRLSSVPAVHNGRVYFIGDPRTVVPGPRVAEGTELLARALHPDAFK